MSSSPSSSSSSSPKDVQVKEKETKKADEKGIFYALYYTFFATILTINISHEQRTRKNPPLRTTPRMNRPRKWKEKRINLL